MRVAGFGFRTVTSAAALKDAYARAGGGADALATLAEKAAAPEFAEFAAREGLPIVAVAREAISGIVTPTKSDRVLDRFGTGSVAEAVALVASGPGARLRGPRMKSEDGSATAAIAERTSG
ncbi:MAG TPA: cobalamin biosynthesis protein [Albidovulum sp.]|uniref:cobalamin biosynthesis protein n=1 Tax=Albidovulum sp. TaxID=1872424 RepID=UPI002B79E631|nr:cobalamin biosynthesis protein [Albidovulum sp.]